MTHEIKSRDWTNLTSSLKEVQQHFQIAHSDIREAINHLIDQLKTEHIYHANPTTSGTIWKAKPLIRCFYETFDPILGKVFSGRQQILEILEENGTALPLSNIVKNKESCLIIANKISLSSQYLEKLLICDEELWTNESQNEWYRIIEDGESLELVASVLCLIFDELSKDVPKWCKICFRRAPSKSIYCDIHNKSTSNDTFYRKSLRLSKRRSNKTISDWQDHRFNRVRLGENLQLFTCQNGIPDQTTPNMTGLIVEQDIRKFVILTQHYDWLNSCVYWDIILKQMPHVNTVFNISASQYKNWNEYCDALLMSLTNNHENTYHPYWIFRLLMDAEDWLMLENNQADQRRTDTENRILELFNQGLNNNQVALKLGISRSHVGVIRKINT